MATPVRQPVAPAIRPGAPRGPALPALRGDPITEPQPALRGDPITEVPGRPRPLPRDPRPVPAWR